MMLKHVPHAVTLLSLCFVISGCGGGEDEPPPDLGPSDGGVTGCIQPSFPAEQPDLSLLDPPAFITDEPNGQARIRPGESVEAEVTVNGATRYARVELGNAWYDSPPLATQEFDTSGNETLEVLFATDVDVQRGRYYLRITLCGSDCAAQEVVFDINPDVNSNYERTVRENDEVLQVDRTCLDVLPAATVVIQ
jgi:hypothetical protein